MSRGCIIYCVCETLWRAKGRECRKHGSCIIFSLLDHYWWLGPRILVKGFVLLLFSLLSWSHKRKYFLSLWKEEGQIHMVEQASIHPLGYLQYLEKQKFPLTAADSNVYTGLMDHKLIVRLAYRYYLAPTPSLPPSLFLHPSTCIVRTTIVVLLSSSFYF